MSKIKVVAVTWVDSQISDAKEWLSEDEFSAWCDEGLPLCRSVGWLTYENDDFIVLSMTEFDGGLADSMKIPKAAIRSKLDLGEVDV